MTIVIAALVLDAVFSGVGLVPTGPRASRADIFGTVSVDRKLVLNLAGLIIFVALMY